MLCNPATDQSKRESPESNAHWKNLGGLPQTLDCHLKKKHTHTQTRRTTEYITWNMDSREKKLLMNVRLKVLSERVMSLWKADRRWTELPRMQQQIFLDFLTLLLLFHWESGEFRFRPYAIFLFISMVNNSKVIQVFPFITAAGKSFSLFV